MTLDAELDHRQAQSQTWHARRVLRIYLPTGLAVLLVAAFIGWIAYGTTYQPLGLGGDGVAGPHIGVATDGISANENVIVGPPGTRGWVSYSLANNGPFDARLLGPDADAAGFSSYRWAPLSLPGPDGATRSPTFADAHPFPVSLRAGQSIMLFVLVTKPYCQQGSKEIVTGLAISWTALTADHDTALPLNAQDPSNWPIALCCPESALRYLQAPAG